MLLLLSLNQLFVYINILITDIGRFVYQIPLKLELVFDITFAHFTSLGKITSNRISQPLVKLGLKFPETESESEYEQVATNYERKMQPVLNILAPIISEFYILFYMWEFLPPGQRVYYAIWPPLALSSILIRKKFTNL